jgi:hypothetical protein
MMTASGYGQPMMHGIMPPQTGMQQQPQQQPPPQQQQPVQQQQHPAQQQDDLAIKAKRSFTNFDTSLKVNDEFILNNIQPNFI